VKYSWLSWRSTFKLNTLYHECTSVKYCMFYRILFTDLEHVKMNKTLHVQLIITQCSVLSLDTDIYIDYKKYEKFKKNCKHETFICSLGGRSCTSYKRNYILLSKAGIGKPSQDLPLKRAFVCYSLCEWGFDISREKPSSLFILWM